MVVFQSYFFKKNLSILGMYLKLKGGHIGDLKGGDGGKIARLKSCGDPIY